MQYRKEASILKIIKFTPPIFTLLLSCVITVLLYFDYTKDFQEKKERIEQQYIKENKLFIKSHVERIYDYINNQYALTETKLKESIKQRVYEAHAIATRIYNENKTSKSKQEIQTMIQNALVDIRFNDGRGYFYIYSFDYKCILLPIARELEGKSFYNYKDSAGRYLMQEVVQELQDKEEGFKTWYYHKPNDMKNQYPKIGFNKHFKPYNWFIGTGEYLDDFENSIKQNVLNYINTINLQSNGYIFTFDKEGTYLTYFNKGMLGKNILKTQDSLNQQNLFERMQEITRNGKEGYITYMHDDKPFIQGESQKISYVKGVHYWNWIIGSGFYTNDNKNNIEELKEQLKHEFTQIIQNLLIFSVMLTLILLVVSVYISKIFSALFVSYKKEIKTHVLEKEKQQSLLAQQSKMAAMGEMMSNIAHQWRQPLNTITTASTGLKLQKEMGILSDEDFEHALNGINESAVHLSKTIDDFRNFFKRDKEKVHFSIKKSIEKTFNLTEAQFKNKEIQIISHIQDIELYNFENEFIQVILNILNNARDQLILKQKGEERLIFIEVKEVNEQAVITIKDNAGGFKEDIIPYIFDPYFTTKKHEEGTGIGLYMSKEIIQKHMKGKLSATNVIINHHNKMFKGAQMTIVLNTKEA